MNLPIAGELAAVGTSIMWSVTALLFSLSSRRMGSLVVSQSRLLFALVLLAALHLLLEGSLFPFTTEPFRWGWLGLSSLLGLVLGDTLLFQAFVLIGPRLSMLIMALVPIVNTAAGWILFGEAVSGLELTGIALAVGAVAWVVTERRGRTVVADKQYGRGLLFALGGLVGQATNLIAAKYGLVGDYPALSATLLRIFVAVVVLWGVTLLRRQAQATIGRWRDRPAFLAMVAASVTGPVLGIWLSLVAVQLARLGIASTLMALPPVFLIPLEYLVERKPITARSVAGTLAALAGVALILLAGT